MVEETNFKGKMAYKCKKCGWLYKEKEIAKKCEDWCKKNNSCNLIYQRHAIKI